MANQLITAPTSEPLSLSEAKAHLRVEQGDKTDDAYITTLIQVAREVAEGRQWRALMPQTREQTFDCFPAGGMLLEYPPLVSVSSVKYVDLDGNEQTWDSSNYYVDTDSIYGSVTAAYNVTYPSTRNVKNAVRVRYVCGYANAAAVPAATKQAMLLLIGSLYEHREDVVIGATPARIEGAVDSLLNRNSAKRFV